MHSSRVSVFLASVLFPVCVSAQTDSERIEMLEAQIAAQQKALDAMRQEIERLKSSRPAAVSAAAQAPHATGLPDQVGEQQRAAAEQEPVAINSPGWAEENELHLYGHVQLDAIYDFGRIDPTWEATFRPTTIPTVDGVYGDDGNSTLSVNQTQFGFKASTATPLGPLDSWFEFDFFGTGSDAGHTKFNLRQPGSAWAGSVSARPTVTSWTFPSFPT